MILLLKLIEKGFDIVSGGTDNHLLLVKTDSSGLTGKEAEAILEQAHITCNKNMIPGDKRSPFVTSGIRLGTPALTTRGLKENHMELVAQWIDTVLRNSKDDSKINKVRQEVTSLCLEYPVY